MSELQFFIRHQPDYIQEKFILVFKSNEARDYFKQAIKGSWFEEISSETAEQAVRIGIKGKTIPYGYTLKLTDEEMNKLRTASCETTEHLLTDANDRVYREVRR